MFSAQIVPGHVGVAVVDHVRHADQICGGVPDVTGVRRAPAVRGAAPERGPKLHHTRRGDVRVPIPGRRFVREREIPGHGGRPADQSGGQLRVPRSRHGVQRAAVRGPVAGLCQGQVQRMIPQASVGQSLQSGGVMGPTVQ